MAKLLTVTVLASLLSLGTARDANADCCCCPCGGMSATYAPAAPVPEAAPTAPAPPQAAAPAPGATARGPQTYRSFSAEPRAAAPRMDYGRGRARSGITGWGLPKADPRKYSVR